MVLSIYKNYRFAQINEPRFREKEIRLVEGTTKKSQNLKWEPQLATQTTKQKNKLSQYPAGINEKISREKKFFPICNKFSWSLKEIPNFASQKKQKSQNREIASA